MLKPQDILLLLKLVSLGEKDSAQRWQVQDAPLEGTGAYRPGQVVGWRDADTVPPDEARGDQSVRGLAASLGISKSEVSVGLRRTREAGLLISLPGPDGIAVNRRALLGIIEHALPYFFPVRPGPVARGIPTAYAAPVMQPHMLGLSDLPPVWPDSLGTVKGQSIEPLYRSVPQAIRKDRRLYDYLALVDSVRLGAPRERSVAMDVLKGLLGNE